MENRINYIDDVTGKRPTAKQLEVLILLNPFVYKTNYWEVARTIGISRSAVQKRMCNLEKRCPSIYKKFKNLRKILNDRNHRRRLSKPWLLDPKVLEEACDGEHLYGDDFFTLRVKETF